MIELQFLGQCGFRIRLGDLCLVTDPCLSGYIDETSNDGVLEWKRAYPPPCTLRELAPDVILISHSHPDHMDPWTLTEYAGSGETGCVVAPAPETYRLAPMGFQPDKITGARAGETVSYGDVLITPVPCAHTELHQDEQGDYYELSYMIEFRGMKLFFGGDMSLYDGLGEYLKNEKPQIMMLPVNGSTELLRSLGVIGNLSCTQAAELAADVGTEVFIPMHHDLYPVNGCPEEDIVKAARACGAPLDLIRAGEVRVYK